MTASSRRGGRGGALLRLLLALLCCGGSSLAVAASCSSSHGSSSHQPQLQQQQQQIPRILHRNYMGGAAALRAAASGPHPDFKAHWLGSCTAHHPGWQEVLWDEPAVLGLIQSDFPWFLRTYVSYPRLVQRSDVMRYLVLYKYGGVYLDADVECFTSMEASLQGRHLVFNCEDPGAWGQLHNAAMASTPGHPFWLAVLQEAMRRAPAAAAADSSWLAVQLNKLWQRTPFHDNIVDVLHSTGPVLLTDVYQSFTGGAPTCGHTVTANGTVSTAYPVGAWFTPCQCGDDECAWLWTVQHFRLLEVQGEQGSVQVPVSAWLKNKSQHHQRKQRHHQQLWERRQQQQQQHSGSVHVHQLAAQELPVVGIHHYSASWTGWDQSHRLVKLQQLKAEMSQHVLDFFSRSAGFLQHVRPSHADAGAPGSLAAPAAAAANPGPALSEPTSWARLLQRDVASGSCMIVTVLDREAASTAAAPAPAAPAAAAVDCPAPHCTGSKGSCPSSSSPTEGAAGCLCPAAGAQQHAAKANSTSSGDAGCSGPSVQQAELHNEQLLRQQGCDVVLVTPGSAGVLILPAALLHPRNNTRLLLRLSCSGCEVAVLQQLAAAAPQGQGDSSALDSLAGLIVDLPGPLTNSSRPRNSAAPGLDDLFNLLHQQLGFRGAWRQQQQQQQLSSSTLRLAWVRQPTPHTARMQPPGSSPAADVLRAASASTPRAQLVTSSCDCCSACCSRSPQSTAGSGWLGHSCPLWQRAACRFSARSRTACPALVPELSEVSASSSTCADGQSASSSQRCSACCACSQSLWHVLQTWVQSVGPEPSGSIASASSMGQRAAWDAAGGVASLVTAALVGVGTAMLLRVRYN